MHRMDLDHWAAMEALVLVDLSHMVEPMDFQVTMPIRNMAAAVVAAVV